jgi:serine/threonine-protein kinase RsbW
MARRARAAVVPARETPRHRALRGGTGGKAVRARVAPVEVGGIEAERLLELSLSAVPASCARARDEIGAALQGLAVDMAAVALAASEAITNAVVHAYRHRESPHADDRVHVRVTADADGVWIIVADDGVGMSPRDDSPGLGLGLNVIAKVTDQLLIVQGDTGTRVHMRFSLAGAAAAADEPR